MNSPNLNASAYVNAPVGYTQSLSTFMRSVFAYMTLGLVVTFLTAVVTMQAIPVVNGTPQVSDWFFVAVLLQVLLVIPVVSRGLRSRTGGVSAFIGFMLLAVLNGITLAPVAMEYTTGSLVQAFAATACMFGGAALWGFVTKSDLTTWGTTLLMLLIGVIVMTVINLFVGSSTADMALAGATILLFVGMTAYDVQKLEKMYQQRAAASSSGLAIYGALSLYLDVLNLVLAFLRIFGVRTDN